MSLQRIEALVLRTTKYSETSLIASLYSRQIGRTTAIAKGARRPGGKTAQALQPTHVISCIRYAGRSSDVKTVSQVELIVDRPTIAASPFLFGVAARGLELVLYQTPPEAPSPSLYHLLNDFLTALQETPESMGRILLLSFELRLQRILGYGFTLRRCARCGNAVTQYPLLLSSGAGGVVCRVCSRAEDVLVRIGRSDYSLLAQLLHTPFSVWRIRCDDRRISGLDRFAEQIWQYHSPGYRESASMLYLSEVEGSRYANGGQMDHHGEPVQCYPSASSSNTEGDAT